MANAKSCDQLTMQEQLEEKLRENLQLNDVNRKLIEKNAELEKLLSEKDEAYTQEYALRQSMQMQLYRLKAMLWDKEHPEMAEI